MHLSVLYRSAQRRIPFRLRKMRCVKATVLTKAMLSDPRFSIMLFCNAALQYATWRMYGSRYTYQLDRPRSKAGSIREGMAASRGR